MIVFIEFSAHSPLDINASSDMLKLALKSVLEYSQICHLINKIFFILFTKISFLIILFFVIIIHPTFPLKLS